VSPTLQADPCCARTLTSYVCTQLYRAVGTNNSTNSSAKTKLAISANAG